MLHSSLLNFHTAVRQECRVFFMCVRHERIELHNYLEFYYFCKEKLKNHLKKFEKLLIFFL